MKIIKTIFLLLILAGISILAEFMNVQEVKNERKETLESKEANNNKVRTFYNFDVEYVANRNSFVVNENIKWLNVWESVVDTFYFNLPKSLQENSDDFSFLKYEINSFTINGMKAEFNIINKVEKNFLDSTLAEVVMNSGLEPNEEIVFEINYDILLPEPYKYSDGQFYNFENWFISVLPFMDGKHYKYLLHKYIEPFLEFSDYKMNLKIPEGFNIAASGDVEKNSYEDGEMFNFSANGVSNFNWFAFNELSKHEKRISINDKELDVIIYIKDSKDSYVEKYFDATERYMKSLAKFAVYPYSRLVIIDLPNVSNLKSKSYSNLISLKSDLISPVKTQKIEYKLASLLAEQYFGNIIVSNSMEESWLSKGLSAYVGEKLVREHYGDLVSFFNVADYYPIYGLRFMSYAGIPLIYTIGEHVIPEGARYISSYYDNLVFADLSIPTYKLPTYNAYKVSSVVKPQIALLTLQKFIGEKNFENKMVHYFKKNLFQYSSSMNFLSEMGKGSTLENINYYDELFMSDKTFDYAISSIEEREDNQYDIMVERIGSGIVPIKLSINREIDTLHLKWNGRERFKVFTITSSSKIISAEIDSENKNLMDLNFANNSYVVEEQYWGSISYATRVFFWFQNALMLIGSKG